MRAEFARIFPTERERVGWIDAARNHAHQNFFFVRLRSRDLFQFQDFRRAVRSEEHTSELQSQSNIVCRLLLEKKIVTFDRVASDANVVALFLFLLWIYYTAYLFLLGGEVAETYDLVRMRRSQRVQLG